MLQPWHAEGNQLGRRTSDVCAHHLNERATMCRVSPLTFCIVRYGYAVAFVRVLGARTSPCVSEVLSLDGMPTLRAGRH